MYLFTIEGNIGSGKSTFIALLKQNLKHVYGIPVVYIPEPVEEWEKIQSKDGKNMIELFYEDQHKYAFSFQMMAYITRLHYLQKEIAKYPDCILISERSLLADYHVFAKMLYESGHISHENYTIYEKWFWEFLKDIEVTGIIYLKTTPELCFERCGKRSRKGENEISIEYLTTCSNMHEKWLDNEPIQVHNLDNNTENEIEDVEMFIKYEINSFIQPEEKNTYIVKTAAIMCLCVIVVSYLCRIWMILDRIS